MKSIGKYDQHDRLKICIGMVELWMKTSKVTKTSQVWNENVPDSEQQVPKCPTFRLNLVKCKDENVPDSNQQGTKRSQIPISKDEKVPYSNQQGRKRPRLRYYMFGFNAIKCDFWENMRICAVKTKICGIMRRGEERRGEERRGEERRGEERRGEERRGEERRGEERRGEERRCN